MKVEAWNENDFYDLASDPDDAAEMRDPAHAAHYRAVLSEEGALLDAFWYFDRQDDVVEVGIGLRPDLTGHGRGESFLRTQLDYARAEWAPATFRLFVAAWNERAIRLYERLGFREAARETRHFQLAGDHEFVQMERPA